MPTTYWTEEEVEEHTRRAVKIAVEHEREQCAILAEKYMRMVWEEAPGAANDLPAAIRGRIDPCN